MSSRRESHEDLVARLDEQAARREAEVRELMTASAALGLVAHPDVPAGGDPEPAPEREPVTKVVVDVPRIAGVVHRSRSDMSPDPTVEEVRQATRPSSYEREHADQLAAWSRRDDDDPTGTLGEVRRLGRLEEKLAERGVPVTMTASTDPTGRRRFELKLADDLPAAERRRALDTINRLIDDNRGDNR